MGVSRGVADHGLDVDVCVAVGEVGITQAVVVLRFRAAEQFTAATAAADQELDGLGEAGLALAVSGVDDHQSGVEVERAGLGAEGSEPANLQRHQPRRGRGVAHGCRQVAMTASRASSRSFSVVA